MDEMINNAEEFYQSLGIAYRIVNIVSGEWESECVCGGGGGGGGWCMSFASVSFLTLTCTHWSIVVTCTYVMLLNWIDFFFHLLPLTR